MPAPSSVWYGCMITAPRSPQYAFSVPIISWKFTRRRLRIVLDGHRPDEPRPSPGLAACPEAPETSPGRVSSGPSGGVRRRTAVVLVRRRDHAQRLAGAASRSRVASGFGAGLRSPNAFARERERTVAAALADRSARLAASSRRAAPPPRTPRSSSDAADSPRARAASAGTRGRAGRAPARASRTCASSRTSRNRVSASNASRVPLLLGEEAQHRLEPDEPDGQIGTSSSRAPRCARTSDAPVTVPSSPLPWWSISSTWLSGSSRPPNRDFVRRIPFATAPTRPRSSVYRCRTRSASPKPKRAQDDGLSLVAAARHRTKCRERLLSGKNSVFLV